MRTQVLRAADYRRMRWKNGGGATTELAVLPESSGDVNGAFDWRISIADIESDGAFSAFVGCDRYIALLDGIGMELRFDAAESVRLDQPALRLAAEDNKRRLISGPVRDFSDRAPRCGCGKVLHRPLVGPMVFLPETVTGSSISPVATPSGLPARCRNSSAADPCCSLRLAKQVVLNGGGELVLVNSHHAVGIYPPKNSFIAVDRQDFRGRFANSLALQQQPLRKAAPAWQREQQTDAPMQHADRIAPVAT